MSNIIHAEQRFGDKALMESIDYKIWHYDRYWLGLTVEAARRAWNSAEAHVGNPPITDCRVKQFEDLYMGWLAINGDEVADR